MLRIQLKVASGKHQGQLISLQQGNFLVGREQDCQLRPSSELVSRHHCVFKVDDYGVRLRDLGSTNGTTVNGNRVQQHQLEAGDLVVIGDLNLEVVLTEVADAAPAEASLPSVLDGESSVPGSETLLEIPTIDPNDSSMDFDSAVAPAAPAEQAPAEPAPAEAQQPAAPAPEQAPAAPPAPVAQPAPVPPAPPAPAPMPPQPQYAPQQPMYQPNPYQPQPGYPQPMAYPPQYQQYPQPGMPYPPQQYPPQQPPMPPQQAPPPAAPPATESETSMDLDVTLPPPEATGAQDAEVKGSAGAGVNKEDPSSRADDIIKQMKTRGRG